MSEHEGGKKEYETSLKYTSDHSHAVAGAGKLSSVLGGLAHAAHEAKHAVHGVGEKILGGVGLGLGEGIVGSLKEIASKSFEANMELGAMRKQVAGTLIAFQDWKPGVDMITRVRASMRDAKEVTEELEESEMKLAVPLGELTAAYRMLGGPVMQKYNASQKEAAEFTSDVAAAAKLTNSDLGSVSFAITKLLETRKLPRAGDPVNNMLIDMFKNSKNLQTLRPDKLFEMVSGKMHDMGVGGAEMAKGVGGAMFQMKAFFEHTLRDIGTPAFEFIGEKIKEWSKSLQVTGADGKKLYETIGIKLRSAVKDIVELGEKIGKHWKEIVYAFGAIKMTGMLTDTARWASTLAGAEHSAHGIAGALGGIRNLGPLVIALEVGGAAGAWLAHQLNEGGQWGDTGAGKMWQRGMATIAQHLPGGVTDEEMSKQRIANQRMREMNADKLHALRKLHGLDVATGMPTPATVKYGDPSTGKPLDYAHFGIPVPKPGLPDTKDLTRRGSPVNNFYGDIKVQQEFKEADPDNVMVRMMDDINNQAESRLMSPLSPAFGGRVG